MFLRVFCPLAVTSTVLLLAGCATSASSDSAESSSAAGDRAAETGSRAEVAPEPMTATEVAVAERRSASSGGSEVGGGTAGDMAKLVDQLSEAARELATLRTANAKLRSERERVRSAPAADRASKADPADERLAASLKSYAQFKQEMANFLGEMDRLKKSNADMGEDLKAAAEQVRQAKTALARGEDDLRIEKRLRQEAEANAGQLRDQLRTIARAMADAGLSSEKLISQAESGGGRTRTTARTPSRYVVREGDTLMKIADRLYGDSDQWRVILEANRGRVGADGAVEPGIELQIPRK